MTIEMLLFQGAGTLCCGILANIGKIVYRIIAFPCPFMFLRVCIALSARYCYLTTWLIPSVQTGLWGAVPRRQQEHHEHIR
jgi:hypothetical protein